MDLEQSLDHAVAVYTQYESSTWEALETAMHSTKMPKRHAERILEFMPFAFGRVLMKDSGVEFQDTYERKKPGSNKSKEFSFASNPVFLAAFAYAERQAASKSGLERLNAVANRSPELKAVEESVNKGVEAGNIVLSRPVLGWTKLPEDPDEKAWWHVW